MQEIRYSQKYWKQLLDLFNFDKSLINERIIKTNEIADYEKYYGIVNLSFIEFFIEPRLEGLYYNTIKELDNNFSLIKSISGEQIYCDKINLELERFTGLYRNGEIDSFKELMSRFSFIEDYTKIIESLIEYNDLYIKHIKEYITDKQNDLYIRLVDEEFDTKVVESKKEQQLQLKEVFKEENYYNFIISNLKERKVDYCKFRSKDGYFVWDKNKKEHLVGFARKLELAGRLKDEYSGKTQKLRIAFTNYFHCATSERTWRFGDYVNNDKFKEFTFITDF